MRRLSGIDADMLYGETPTWHMHVGGLVVLDPATTPGGFDFATARRLVVEAAADVPPLRERIVTVPFGLDRPVWVADPAFDVDAHLRRVVLPAPGGARELAELAGEFTSAKLDRGRPLWEIWFVEGLEDGCVAMLSKIHHACGDGVAGSMLMGRMFDPAPTARTAGRPTEPVTEELPSAVGLLAGALPSLVTLPWRMARTAGRTAASVAKLARRPRRDGQRSAAGPFRGPTTSFNRPVTARRSLGFVELPLADVKQVARAFDAKVNDVVLAVCAGALRRYLADLGELPDAPLVAAVPVSLRTTEEDFGSFGNMVSGWFANLATDLEDPVARLRMIRDAARSAKRVYESGVEDVVMDWAELPAPAVWSLAIRFYVWSQLSERMPPIFNLLVSNVPGPPVPLYAAGALVRAVYPFGPVLDSIGLNITVISYADSVEFGVMTCPDLVPDVWALVDRVPHAMAELVDAAAAS
ncbi:MAG: wax ester/triacylglycerol synthase family O-acyltransferase [Acidimicrobiia bacterium]